MQTVENLVRTALEETGAELQASAAAIAHLTSLRAAELTTIVGQPGYEQAAIAARDEIALAAGLAAVSHADRSTGRVLSIIQGGLMLAAGALA